MVFMESKMLVVGFFILCVANLTFVVVAFTPFFYSLGMVVQIGETDPFLLNADYGLFYMSKDYFTRFHNILLLEELDNHIYANHFLTMAQLFFITGFLGTLASMFGALLLSLKTYMAVPASIILAGVTLASTVLLSVSVVMAFIPAIIGYSYWSHIPSTETTTSFGIATVKLNVIFYIEVIGTILTLIAGIFLLVEACRSCTAINTARQQQMREKPKTVSAGDKAFENFSYTRTPRRGPPAQAYTVTYQSAPRGGYEPPRGGYEPPRGGYAPQAPPAYSKAPTSPGFIPPVQAPPSPQGSPRGGYVSRQIEI